MAKYFVATIKNKKEYEKWKKLWTLNRQILCDGCYVLFGPCIVQEG